MSNIANNMLVLARLDNAPTHREQEVINLAEIAQTGVRRIQALADQLNIQLQLEAETALVIGDQAQLEQAALALLDNALKYNRQSGQVTIRTLVDGNKALLEVSDTGIGIDAENLQHLGERFYRVDKARSREMGGTGLGISIVQTIARTHNGSLHLESVPDKGTTVTLNLPVVHERLADHDRTPAEENATSLPK
jgi:signal transduction histidine kinase